MDVFFKPVLFFAVVFGLFAFLFVQSGTLEMKQEEYTDRGMPMKRTIYNLHWDRFGNYVTSIPGRISNYFGGSN
ncbi:MAG TPA: hypothetical protein PKM25_14110 [Candidatus Ozemobacteraceae bacterium]|nr:hypothetical protein [Candidatus Ozemobacteraceae bacterium]